MMFGTKFILPRFIRLNKMKGDSQFTAVSANGHDIPTVPLDLQRGFSKKRIDHRHHAMDAIVIACVNRSIVNYLNNLSANEQVGISRRDLQALLCVKSKTDHNGNYEWLVKKPWETFTQDALVVLQNIIVSFKQNLRVINKTTNRYTHYEQEKKVSALQTKGTSWAIRKPMHKDTVFGEVNLRRIKYVPLKEAFKRPQDVVEKDLKKELCAMVERGWSIEQAKKHFEETETFGRMSISQKLRFIILPRRQKNGILQLASYWIRHTIGRKSRKKSQIQVFKKFCSAIWKRMVMIRNWHSLPMGLRR